jgi:hypothetical protein
MRINGLDYNDALKAAVKELACSSQAKRRSLDLRLGVQVVMTDRDLSRGRGRLEGAGIFSAPAG